MDSRGLDDAEILAPEPTETSPDFLDRRHDMTTPQAHPFDASQPVSPERVRRPRKARFVPITTSGAEHLDRVLRHRDLVHAITIHR
jgi:hypothetical protein